MSKINIVLFQYSSDTPTEKILRHHFIARWIIYPWGFSGITTLSVGAEVLLFGANPISMAIVIAWAIVSLTLMIPAVFCFLWLSEIEGVLKGRGIPIPGGKTIDERCKDWAIMVMLWSACIIFGPWLVKSIVN
ncbi:MAG: hypothetical protein ACYTBJ_22035 [Planctomycetota bacterium]